MPQLFGEAASLLRQDPELLLAFSADKQSPAIVLQRRPHHFTALFDGVQTRFVDDEIRAARRKRPGILKKLRNRLSRSDPFRPKHTDS